MHREATSEISVQNQIPLRTAYLHTRMLYFDESKQIGWKAVVNNNSSNTTKLIT